MDINRNAPLLIKREIEIFAPPEMIWDWISRVDLWPDWHPEIAAARWQGSPGANSTFKWRIWKVVGITSKVESWEPDREFGWTGEAWSSRVRQVFRISGDFRRTRITAEASVEGPACNVAPLRAVIGGEVARINEILLGMLKTRLEAEQPQVRAGDPTATTGLPNKPAADKPLMPSERVHNRESGWK